MEELLYPMIFKRKSFHIFKGTTSIHSSELKAIEETYQTFQPLVSGIKTDIKIVPAEKTTCKRGEEFCILLYSEKKDHYLQNIGYIGEQLDLYLSSLGIGALWFGIGKPEDAEYEYKKPGKRGIMPVDRVTYYNKIDIGIFLLFLDLCFAHEHIDFERTLHDDSSDHHAEKTLLATYRIFARNT